MINLQSRMILLFIWTTSITLSIFPLVGWSKFVLFFLEHGDVSVITRYKAPLASTDQEMVRRAITEHLTAIRGPIPCSSQPVQKAGNKVSKPGPPDVFLKMFGSFFRSNPQLT